MKQLDSLAAFKQAGQLSARLLSYIKAEDLIRLAEKGLAPHILVCNPLTGEEKIYFKSSDVEEWLLKSCIRHVDADYTNKFAFYYFDEKQFLAHENYDVPKELMGNDLLLRIPLELFHLSSGVYFLYNGDELVYIGESNSVVGRIHQHKHEKVKSFDRVFFIPCPNSLRKDLERALIVHYQPPFNTSGKRAKLTEEENKLLHKFLENKAVDGQV